MQSFFGLLVLSQQFVASLATKSLKILNGVLIGRDDLQHLPGFQLRQGFLGTQDGQGAFQPACIHLQIAVGQSAGLGHRHAPNLLWTQACTEALACGKTLASVPPPMAISGRPPPFPPICEATKPTRSPALTLEVRSGVTPATRLTLPSATMDSRITADCSLFFN